MIRSKDGSLVVAACALVIATMFSNAAAAQSAGEARFLDPTEIRISRNQVERPDEELLAWGRARLSELGVEGRSSAERAEIVARYIHEQFAFNPERPKTIANFIEAKGGNCYAHARLSAFLLRLAGVPARFMYEVHLERKRPESSEQARARGIGLFGQYHNDHFWLLYHDGRSWIPFDSALGIANREDFRRVKIDAPAGGVANPPFLLWQESADPAAPMENVTARFWAEIGRTTIPGVKPADWKTLLNTVGTLEVSDLHQPLSPEREAAIAHVARQFFADPPK